MLGAALLVMVQGVALADNAAAPRRPNFFERLFGVKPSRPQPVLEIPGKRIRNDVNIIYGIPKDTAIERKRPSKRVVALNAQSDTAEPEPLPGLGMGIIPYQPPLVLPVYDPAFGVLHATTPEGETIRQLMADKATPVRTVEAERKAILAFYAANGFKPLWTENGHANARAAELLKVLAAAGDDGLQARNYLPEVLSDFDKVDESLAGDPVSTARFDVGLTVAVVRYARHISGGQFDPQRLSLYNDIKTEPVKPDEALKTLGFTPFPVAYLQGLAPKNPQYAVLKAELAKHKDVGAPVEKVADSGKIKLGKSDPRVPLLRTRLTTLGYGSADGDPPADPLKFDQDLSIAVMAFQTASNLKPTGTIDSNTIKALNVDSAADERQKLVASLERLRWLPKNLGSRHVFVNQAAFEVNVMDNGQSAWKSRVIVGKPMTQTYSFSDQIETVVFNPTWGVPASIIVNEYGPKSRKDPGYLDRNGFKVVDAKGNQISSRDVDWYNLGQAPTIGVQQLAGNDNALGELKFLFPNVHDIYMHDTPTKNLFKENVRDFSHGCVRVQNPREFAQVLLGWSADKVTLNVEEGDSHSVPLAQKVPVHLAYFTAWPDDTGKVRYYDDIYGRDQAMVKAMNYSPANALKTGVDVMAQTGSTSGLIQN